MSGRAAFWPILAAIAMLGISTAWWRYPEENHFSIMRCTISFLGTPDADRNPGGWRFYQAGMTALVLLLFRMAWLRHHRLRRAIGRVAGWSSGAAIISLTLILLAVWIPDSREVHWFGIRAGKLHTPIAVLAFPIMAAAIILDGAALWWAGIRGRTLWPFLGFALVALLGGVALISWEKMCERDATLRHWPGDGIHSTPLWEWIIFTCLIAFMATMARLRIGDAGNKMRPSNRALE